MKAAASADEAEKLHRDQTKLSETGIRKLRKKPAITTPNVFPPTAIEQKEIEGDPEFREVVEPQKDLLSGSGMFGSDVQVPADADRQTQLLAVLGRKA